MERNLNEGLGICRGTHRLLVKPVSAVISVGASQDVVLGGLRAIHRLNRNGDVTDFIAAALPLMLKIQGRFVPGHELEAVGSEASLQALVDADVIRTMVRRGMLEELVVEPVMVDNGEEGVAYVRDQAMAKRTQGWVRRSRARAARRMEIGKGPGLSAGKPVRQREYDAGAYLTVCYGDVPVHIREEILEYTGVPIKVATYGFSSTKDLCVLPVRPSHNKKIVADAA